MTDGLSPNTRAILLLTGPLLGGRGAAPSELLKLAEYNALARHLREMKRQPADFLGSDAEELIQNCRAVIDETRLRWLLGRGFVLEQIVERWNARNIWVLSRADAEYPRRFKARLRENAPAVIYGCGDVNLLNTGGLAVVGSRHLDDALVDDTMSICRLAAQAGKTLVSGGAPGIDQIAIGAALRAGGRVSAVMADSLAKAVSNREYKNPLRDGQMVLMSPYDPNATFNSSLSTQRNKHIYALADVGLVMSASFRKGQTWAGAVEQLTKLEFVPMYVWGANSEGLEGLKTKGAVIWPEIQDAKALEVLFTAVFAPLMSSQTSLPLQ
ncbi:DNA-processing protein DprA [Azohydromonas aeria]|uniref:DNA-processing protein DprA n=1 Tax=Azohydromonas aeria TaxID=2590212 RepID=UPI0012F9C627|nr:DNA-processing protein DprA [Azohydromonas aeria]